MSTPSQLEIVPLGGLGEFGMNIMVYRHGDDCVIVDAGMMFPGPEHLGVDVIVPDLGFLRECGTIHGLILTHGHEDHIGALPYLLRDHDIPVYAPPHAGALARARLREHESLAGATIRELPPAGEELGLGPFGIEALSASHSIPQAKMLVLRTPVGTVLHTADFKLDPHPPDGEGTDLTRLAEIGREGVLALMCDSTNAEVAGMTPGERSVTAGLDQILGTTRQRVFVTTFSSNVHRLQSLARLAVKHGRRLALVGTSLESQADVAQQLGLLSFPAGLRVAAETLMDQPEARGLFVMTGTQGEPRSALRRAADGKHREVRVGEGDRVLHSARMIPGNEKNIGHMLNQLLRRGAQVTTARDAPIHVSGHPAREELRMLLQLVRPRFVVPIHGEYRQLHANAALAVESGLPSTSVILAESGDVIAVGSEGAAVADRVAVGHVFIDEVRDRVDRRVLLERRRVADDGMVIAVVNNTEVNPRTEIVARGFVPSGNGADGLLRDAAAVVTKTLREVSADERGDNALLEARVTHNLKRFIRRRTQRTPLIIPVILEL